MDGLWEQYLRGAGIISLPSGGEAGPLLGSPVKFTTAAGTTTITLIKPTPYGRCDASNGALAPAGTLVGTFSKSGSSYTGKIEYRDYRKCTVYRSLDWKLDPTSSQDAEPVLEATGVVAPSPLDMFFHRCTNGVPTVDPDTHGGCTQ